MCWQVWNEFLHWSDIAVFGILYVLTGFGVTVGFHRLFTHRSFATKRSIRGVLAVLGSAAIEGPVISWVADHRKHHAFADQPGDPHSPHVDHGVGWRGALRGLAHAHMGWLFLHTQRGSRKRYAPDLLADPVVSYVDRTFLVWAIGGIVAAFGLGWLIGGTLTAALTGLLWGGAVRLLVLHHVTFWINSLCHFFGRRRFDTGDESRNLAWLSLLSFGEAWHNNHHAFPTSAAHGMRWYELDTSSMVIRGLEKHGLAWDVVRIDPARQQKKLLAETPRSRWRSRRPAPLRGALAEALPERPVHASASGTARELPATAPGRASPCARRAPWPMRSTPPGQLGIGRAYVSGELEVDDLDATIEPPADLEAAGAGPRDQGPPGAGRGPRDGPRAPADAARSPSSSRRGAGTRSRATAARCATTTTCRRSSSRSSSTSR